jgi:DNA-3-methyladenine glycosylase I
VYRAKLFHAAIIILLQSGRIWSIVWFANLLNGQDGIFMNEKMRCGWCGDDPLYVQYHDEDWGVPVYDDQQLFAKLVLDGAQAGLSWITILRKRENYWQAFDQFDPEKIARYDEAKIAELLQNPGIVRNRLKVNSAVKNARGYLQIQEEHGSFSDFLWQFVDGKPIQNEWQTLSEIPAETKESQAMSKALKKQGFTFVGPTIIYAFMQAVGMVNDHVVSCFRYEEVKRASN